MLSLFPLALNISTFEANTQKIEALKIFFFDLKCFSQIDKKSMIALTEPIIDAQISARPLIKFDPQASTGCRVPGSE
jgi:hypothetical protein